MRISASRAAFAEILGIDSSALLPEVVIQKYPQLHQILTCVFFVLRCFAPTGKRSAMPRRHASPETAVHPFHRAHCSEKLKARPPTHTKTPGQSHPASVTEIRNSPQRRRDSPCRNGLEASAARRELGFIIADIGQQQRVPHRHTAGLFAEPPQFLVTQRPPTSWARAVSGPPTGRPWCV